MNLRPLRAMRAQLFRMLTRPRIELRPPLATPEESAKLLARLDECRARYFTGPNGLDGPNIAPEYRLDAAPTGR